VLSTVVYATSRARTISVITADLLERALRVRAPGKPHG
jgi:hypothetical protein